jgi:hypothetical protein
MNEIPEKYTIDELIEIFKRHSLKYEKEETERKKKWKEEHEQEYPYESFNLPKALLCILENIKNN